MRWSTSSFLLKVEWMRLGGEYVLFLNLNWMPVEEMYSWKGTILYLLSIDS